MREKWGFSFGCVVRNNKFMFNKTNWLETGNC